MTGYRAQTAQFQGLDLVLAVGVTLIGVVLSWLLAGGVPPIGIDDAAITRAYAENLAGGHGYVYNIGGERVEGATALAWVSILAGVYALFDAPEVPILILTAALTAFSVYCAIRITRHLAIWKDLSAGVAVTVLIACLIGTPGFFLWSVWTMMELALWSATLMWLVLVLGRLTEGEYDWRDPVSLIVAMLLMPVVRPEGIAVGIGLTLLATLLAPRIWKMTLAGIVAALAVFGIATAGRISYFGVPFPNTFYAKVSSDTLQGLKDGLKYLLDFLLNAPFAELHLVLWVGLAVVALLQIRQGRDGAKATLIAAACVFGMLVVYAGLGGDHFALWRFYQPLAPLLPVALAIIVAAGLLAFRGAAAGDRPIGWLGALPAAAAVLALWVTGWMHYYQARFDVRKEFTLVEQGMAFGQHLNGYDPRPSVGTGPAGGIALAYDGEILDLLGLNWAEMAHANPVKVGMRNHASFDAGVFWKHAPGVVAAFNRPCPKESGLSFFAGNDAAFGGLFTDPRFREAYLPVLFGEDGQCWQGFAQPGWAEQVAGDGLQVFDWADVSILN